MGRIFLIIGVPGSGKSWVCERLSDRVHYIRNDDYKDHILLTKAILASTARDILVDVPFGERRLMAALGGGLAIEPLFIVEEVEVIAARCASRGTPARAADLTRAGRMAEIARGYGAFHGTAAQCLHYLKTRLAVKATAAQIEMTRVI